MKGPRKGRRNTFEFPNQWRPHKPETRVTPKQIAAYLDALSKYPHFGQAAEGAGVPYAYMNRMRKENPEFNEAVEEALQLGYDHMESEAVRRATKGVQEPVFFKDEQIATVTRYSDNLMMFMLKGVKRNKFGDRVATEVSGPNGRPIQNASVTVQTEDVQEAARAYAKLMSGDY